MHIRAATVDEANALAGVAWAAKASWGYPPAQLETWREDLTPKAESIHKQPTFVAELEGEIAGFCQIAMDASPVELEHFWVHPMFMGRGVGRALLEQARGFLANSGVSYLAIDADPNAERFYLARGAVRVGTKAAPIAGEPNRVRPQLRLPTSAT